MMSPPGPTENVLAPNHVEGLVGIRQLERIAELHHDPIGKPAALGQHSSSLNQLRRQVDAVDPASITVREIPRRSANAAPNIENPAVLRKCKPLSLLASGGQAPTMEMLDRSKDFSGELLRIMSQLSERGVDPRKHARSRPMRLNVFGAFSHGAFVRTVT
jgi:hypothetical protein